MAGKATVSVISAPVSGAGAGCSPSEISFSSGARSDRSASWAQVPRPIARPM